MATDAKIEVVTGIDEAADRFGAAAAVKLLSGRTGHGQAPATQLHLNEHQLKAILAAAYARGARDAFASFGKAVAK